MIEFRSLKKKLKRKQKSQRINDNFIKSFCLKWSLVSGLLESRENKKVYLLILYSKIDQFKSYNSIQLDKQQRDLEFDWISWYLMRLIIAQREFIITFIIIWIIKINVFSQYYFFPLLIQNCMNKPIKQWEFFIKNSFVN